jgi:hypothetical protein
MRSEGTPRQLTSELPFGAVRMLRPKAGECELAGKVAHFASEPEPLDP